MDKRHDMEDFLYNHIEWEHIEMDLAEQYDVENGDLDELTLAELEELAEKYDYEDESPELLGDDVTL